MNQHSLSPEEFQSIQLGWITTLAQPALSSLIRESGDPRDTGARARIDLSPLATKDGVPLPRNTKIFSDIDPSGTPVVTICYSLDPTDPVKHPYYCLSITNPFLLP